MMSKGASNTIAESAKTTSIARFVVKPTGRGIIAVTHRASRSARFALAKPSMSGTHHVRNPKFYVAFANKTQSTMIVPIASQILGKSGSSNLAPKHHKK
jgi:hypothetical protein